MKKKINREYLYGIHPVLESLKANRRKFYQLCLGQKIKNSAKADEFIQLLETPKISYKYLPEEALTSLCGKTHHQQFVLECGSLPKFSLEEFLALIKQQDKAQKNTWVALDHLQDTQNIGSILRSCLYFGVKKIFLTRHRSPNLSPIISKISAGAMERIDFCIVNNLNSLIERLKQENFWIMGTSLQGENFSTCEVPQNCLLILGNEQKCLLENK